MSTKLSKMRLIGGVAAVGFVVLGGIGSSSLQVCKVLGSLDGSCFR